jgi:hypothetical protein
MQIEIRPLSAGSAGIRARHERRRREDSEPLKLKVEGKREVGSVRARFGGQGCPRSRLEKPYSISQVGMTTGYGVSQSPVFSLCALSMAARIMPGMRSLKPRNLVTMRPPGAMTKVCGMLGTPFIKVCATSARA